MSDPAPHPEIHEDGLSTAGSDLLRPPGTLRRLLRDRFAVAAIIFLGLMLFVGIFAGLLSSYSPTELNAGGAKSFQGPSRGHWLGTDSLGRDNATRIMYGARYALRDSAWVAFLTLAIAVPIGLIAGFYGRWTDTLLMRLIDAIHSIPSVIMVLAVAAATRQSLSWTLLAVAVGFVPTLARLVRNSTLAVREEVYIDASRSIGTPTSRILFKRVLHNVMSPIIVQTSIVMGAAIFVQAALAVLGIGYPVGSAAWGAMLNDAFESIYTSFTNLLYPGLAIALTVLALNLLGDGLRDAFGLDKGNLYGSKISPGLTRVARVAEPVTSQLSEASARTDAPSLPSPDVEMPVGKGTLLSVRNLCVDIVGRSGSLRVLDDFTLDLKRGEVVGLVGESGAGKTVASLSITRLLPSPPFRIASGQIVFDGVDLTKLPLHRLRDIRGREIAMIFQDPMLGLNPSHTIGRQIAEAILLHKQTSRTEAKRRAVEMLSRVGIPDAANRANSYPHEFSGGMRQRAMIAIALACSPKLLIADEPTTALDVTVQAQILGVMRELQAEFDVSIIFVTHDLGVVAEFCDRAVVMYAGQMVEQASVDRLFASPSHPYTEGLLGAIPRLDSDVEMRPIKGQVPPVGSFPNGCRFHPRCPHAIAACTTEQPVLLDRQGSLSRCLRADELYGVGINER